MGALILYGIGILIFSTLFLYFAKMFINTSDTFIDFAKKNINYIIKMKIYNNFVANVMLSAIFLFVSAMENGYPILSFVFAFFVYRSAIIISDKHIKEIKELKKKYEKEEQNNDN
jgi:hypothetical protein